MLYLINYELIPTVIELALIKKYVHSQKCHS